MKSRVNHLHQMRRSNIHIPIRTCISCGIKRNKKELVRLVLDAHGSVIRDDSGKLHGRGAYVCGEGSCWDRLESGKRLNRAFRKEDPVVLNIKRT